MSKATTVLSAQLHNVEIAPEVTKISAALAKEISFDDKGGTKVGSEVYLASLPEGLTPEIVAQVRDHNTNFIAGAAKAVTVAALDHALTNKEISRLTAKIGMGGRDAVNLVWDRQSEGRNPSTGETIVTMGALNVKVDTFAGKKSSGLLSKIRTAGNEAAAELLE